MYSSCRSMQIGRCHITVNQRPKVIAELSANHDGSLDKALRTVRAAAEAGADAIKIQTYTPDSITLNSQRPEFFLQSGPWKGRSLYDLYEEAHTPLDWHPTLFEAAREAGIPIFSTPFDFSAVDLLEGLECPAYKISSFELVDLPLIRYAASTNKPLLISTGMGSLPEIAAAVEAATKAGSGDILIFHCISSYPAPISQANLLSIPKLISEFGTLVGLSDHTLGNTAAVAAASLGACAIEKHFTTSREDGGPDSSFSIEPQELTGLVKEVEASWQSLGVDDFSRTETEAANRSLRRSLYFVKTVRAGEVVMADAVRSVRPAQGLPPDEITRVIGRRVKNDRGYGDPVTYQDIDWD